MPSQRLLPAGALWMFDSHALLLPYFQENLHNLMDKLKIEVRINSALLYY